jgi:hypothetical protein
MSEKVALRVFGPKQADHPSIGRACPLCDVPFHVGDYTCLIGNEPASDDDRAKRDSGRAYTAKAYEVHRDCIPFVLYANKVDELRFQTFAQREDFMKQFLEHPERFVYATLDYPESR